MSPREIFHAALAIDDPAGRAAYLDQVCAGNVSLRQHIDGLLQLEGQLGSFLEGGSPSPLEIETQAQSSDREDLGTVIGPYKLLEQIGEGGFGVVFMAEQMEPVRRKVALKILKPGMDSQQIVARFEAERQALALMDHPNIARVFDGGATPTGRPYFVMELVKGVPITEFCDRNRLTPRQRLELFISVCQAVQHAHQKGIIHRDVKPSNVLVSMHDVTPVVKVIDFGVAKALGQVLTDKTLFTGFAQMVGTPLYMSPEQAGQSALDVDTRSDIYSLGVVLYELLTGTTPFDKQRFKQAAHDEIRRIIREEEPPKPSTRLSTTEEMPSIATNRSSEPKKLSRLVRGELDWIVMKCLEKDRNRRYETANGLAADVQRYLADEPVLACPPSAGYRLRKFLRKNKRPVLAGSLVLLALIGGIIGTSWQAARATRERNQKETARQAAVEQRLRAENSLKATILKSWGGAGTALAQKYEDNSVDVARVTELYAETSRLLNSRKIEEARQQNDLCFEAIQSLEASFLDFPEVQYLRSDAYRMRAHIRDAMGDIEEAENSYQRCLACWRELCGSRPDNVGAFSAGQHLLTNYSQFLFRHARLDEAEEVIRREIRLNDKLASDFPGFTGPNYAHQSNLVHVLICRRKLQEAEQVCRRAINLNKQQADLNRLKQTGDWERSYSWRNIELVDYLAEILAAQGRADEAVGLYREILARDSKEYPIVRTAETISHIQTAMGEVLLQSERACDAKQSFEQAFATLEIPLLRTRRENRLAKACLLLECGLPELRDAKQALALARAVKAEFPDRPTGSVESRHKCRCLLVQGAAHYRLDDLAAATKCLQEAAAISQNYFGLQEREKCAAWLYLAMAYHKAANHEKAKDYFARSVQFIENREPYDHVLRRLRTEAAKVLGLEDVIGQPNAGEPRK
ncbi:MAG: protein kinase domain-containing protein [Gemmataceae bacterium]